MTSLSIMLSTGVRRVASENALRMRRTLVSPLCSAPPATHACSRPIKIQPAHAARLYIFSPSPQLDKLTRRLEDVEKTHAMFLVAAATRPSCI